MALASSCIGLGGFVVFQQKIEHVAQRDQTFSQLLGTEGRTINRHVFFIYTEFVEVPLNRFEVIELLEKRTCFGLPCNGPIRGSFLQLIEPVDRRLRVTRVADHHVVVVHETRHDPESARPPKNFVGVLGDEILAVQGVLGPHCAPDVQIHTPGPYTEDLWTQPRSGGIVDRMSKVEALMRFVAGISIELGIGANTFVVGGAVRNHLLGLPAKDLDIVFDSVAAAYGRDSAWLARELQSRIPTGTNLTTNQYGVAILTVTGEWDLDGNSMKGEVIEIANARRESYGKGGKGYKPNAVEAATILEDIERRDFTINTLMWRFEDLIDGPQRAPVLDLTKTGILDLEARILRTPCDPDRTFTDDPTRMLRAVKFVSRYSLEIDPATHMSIARNADALSNMPWDAVRKILVDDILNGPNPRGSVWLLHRLGLNETIVKLLRAEPGFHAGVSRGVADADTLLLLDLWDLGWHLKGAPGGYLKTDQLRRLREILDNDPANAERFMQALKKPPVNQEALFERFSLQGAARQRVQVLARNQLLLDASLAGNPEELERRVADQLA